MNLTVIVAVRDRAIDTFGRPFFVQSTAQAIRSFSDELNRQAADNEMNKHPEDYDLYQLGHFNQESGEFTNDKRQLAIGKDLYRNGATS